MAAFTTLALLGIAAAFGGGALAAKALAPRPTPAANNDTIAAKSPSPITGPQPPDATLAASNAQSSAAAAAARTRKRATAGGAGNVTLPSGQGTIAAGATGAPKTLIGY